MDNNEFNYVAAIWWITWNARNKLSFQGKRPNLVLLATKARIVMDAYKKVQVKPEESKIDFQTRKQHEWKPLPINHYKINVDAAVQNDKQKKGLGV